MASAIRVFLCSTYGDLTAERALVLDTLRKLQLQHHAMELFGARTELPIEACLAEVRRSDVIIVIVADRYGSLVPGREVSYSEAEYQEAYRLGKTILVYFRSGAQRTDEVDADPGGAWRLDRWKADLAARHTVASLASAQELSIQVIADLSRVIVQALTPDERELAPPMPPVGFMNWYEGTAYEPAPFGGRDGELTELHTWLAEGLEPYALLTAPIGRGKSALVTRFVAEVRTKGGWQVVFVPISVRFGSSQPTQFLRDLVRHFARLYRRTIPAQATAGELDALWRESFSEGPPPDQRPILLVIDALDEAQNWSPDAGFLPDLTPRLPDLPSRLRVLVTARDPADGSVWRRRLGWTSPQLARRFGLSTLSGGGVYAAMASLGYPLDALPDRIQWTAALLRVTQGEPLLVRFYAAELLRRSAEGSPLSLAALAQRPPGLAGYVEDWWSEQQALWGDSRDRRVAEVTSLLDLLAVARGPLTLTDLLALRQSGGGPGAVRQAIDAARRFLAGDGTDEDPYVLGHPALANFFRERLSEPEEKVHADFVRWGQRALAALQEVSAAGSGGATLPRYLFDALRDHLKGAHAPVSEWARLLAIPWIDASIHATSSADAVIADLDAIWDVIEASERHDAGPGAPTHWPEIVACGLIVAGMRAERQAIPATLACRAVTQQVWPLGRFLFYLSSRKDSMDGDDARQAARTLITLGPSAVRTALRVGLPSAVVRVLSELYSKVLHRGENPGTDPEEAGATTPGPDGDTIRTCESPDAALIASLFAATETATTGAYEKSPVVDLAADVPDGWARALAVAEAMPHMHGRAKTLALLAPHVPDGWTRANTAAEALEDPRERALRLVAIAPHIPGGWKRALEAANAIREERYRAASITDVAPHVPDGWTGAIAAAEAVPNPSERASELIHIAEQTPGVWDRAWAAAEDIMSERDRIDTLVEIAPHVRDGWQRLIVAAESIRGSVGEYLRTRAFMAAAPHLPDGWESAIASAEAAESEQERVMQLLMLAPHVPGGWARAWTALESFSNKRERADALIRIAPHVPDGWARAVQAAEEYGDPVKLTHALVLAAPHVPDGWARASEAAETLEDPDERAKALARIAKALPEMFPRALAAAVATAASQADRALALAALAPKAPSGWTRALAAADAIVDKVGRARALAAVAAHVAGGWARARAAASAIVGEVDRVNALITVAPHVEDGWAQAWAEAETIPTAVWRVNAFSTIAPHIQGGWLRVAAEAELIPYADNRAAELIAAAPHVPDGWERAFAAAEANQGSIRIDLLILCAPHVSDGWTRVFRLGGSSSRMEVRALVAAAPHVPDGWAHALAAAAEAPDPRDRCERLVLVAPHVPDGWSRVLDAALEVSTEEASDVRTRALIAAAPYLPKGWELALAATSATKYDKYRSRAVIALAPNLPEETLPLAVEVARSIRGNSERSDALAALAPRCPEVLLDVRWKDCPALFDVVADLTRPLEGRIAMFRREFSSTSSPASILRLVARAHAEEHPWPISDDVAARLATAIEATGRRWP